MDSFFYHFFINHLLPLVDEIKQGNRITPIYEEYLCKKLIDQGMV